MNCQVTYCDEPATHRSGWANTHQLNGCVTHTRVRELWGAWSRSITTTRERREARAERLRGWAEKRETKAAADLERARNMASVIPFGQPILAGHYSERSDRNYRDRIGRTFDRSFEHAKKAESMTSRAAGIEAQLDRSIYSDDVDAIERLEERIAELEAERDRIKAFNDSCRKAAKTGGVGDTSILNDAERQDLMTLARVAAFQLRPGGAFPAYKLTNLSGNIKRNRDRLAQLKAAK